VDFGEALAVIGGVRQKIHFFCLDLPQSDACFVKAYPRETTEAFLDGHVSAFAFFNGVPLSLLYDNTKIAVAKICGDGRRDRTRAFTELVSHCLFQDRFGRPHRDHQKEIISSRGCQILGPGFRVVSEEQNGWSDQGQHRARITRQSGLCAEPDEPKPPRRCASLRHIGHNVRAQGLESPDEIYHLSLQVARDTRDRIPPPQRRLDLLHRRGPVAFFARLQPHVVEIAITKALKQPCRGRLRGRCHVKVEMG